MGVGYTLLNMTKRETVGFYHVAASTAHELAGNPASAAIATWYLLRNIGDQIVFVSDTHDDWPFSRSANEQLSFPDKTDEIVAELIANGILRDEGYLYQDPEEPDTVYIRDLKNCWGEER